MRIIVFPFNMQSSKSDARIQERIEELLPDIDCIRVYPDRNYRPTAGDLIVGWGAGNPPAWRARVPVDARWINRPNEIARCVDKITTLRILTEARVRVVPWTRDKRLALDDIQEGYRVVARALTEGRDGEGASILSTVEEVEASNAPLYTVYIPKTAEYRVHVFNDAVLGVQKRVRADGKQITNRHIRTSSNGWGLTRDWNVQVPEELKQNAVLAVRSLGLTFGACDIGVDRFGRDFIFEVNSAPEVLGAGVDLYARAIIAAANDAP